MVHTLSSTELIRVCGIGGVVFFPREAQAACGPESRTAEFLSSVGLPHGPFFHSRTSVADADPVLLSEHCVRQERTCPPESRSWLLLGFLSYSLVAVDPVDGTVYAFPDCEQEYIHLHRDVESLAYAVCALRETETVRMGGNRDPSLVHGMRARIEAFDGTVPFDDENSEWHLVYEELLEGVVR